MTMPPALRRAVPHLMLAAFVLPTGLLHAQKAGKGQNQGPKDAAVSTQPAAPPFVPSPQTAPPVVTAQDGKVDAPLYAVFGEVTIPGLSTKQDLDGKIAVRSYALGQEWLKGKTPPSIPGPTFVFQPGDLLRLRFHNYLNRAADPALNAFQNNPQQGGPAASDDTDEHVSHEISIPNDSNVTNLHVHGLHVDPKQDDVTLLVLPEDNDPGALTPELQRFVPTINRWWTRTYQYKLPEDHLPGTYWYHSHKHGSTSSQVENGMAGTLIIRPDKEEDDPVPGLWASGHDRIMMIQELANYSTPAMLKADGQGQGQGKAQNLNNPVTTVNGLHKPVLQLPPGQVERWRFIVAGANHTTSSYIWVGRISDQIKIPDSMQKVLLGIYAPPPNQTAPPVSFPEPATYACTTMPGKVKLIALDGITMWQSRDITASQPAFGSAGNRMDLLVQFPADQKSDGLPWYVYQNYPIPTNLTVATLAKSYPDIFGGTVSSADAQARLNAMLGGFVQKDATKPSIQFTEGSARFSAGIPTDPFTLGTNYQSFTPWWVNVDEQGKPIAKSASKLPVVPLLKGRPTANKGVEIDPGFAQTFAAKQSGWQPIPDAPGGAAVSANALVTLDISGQASGPKTIPETLDSWLFTHSPAGAGNDKTQLQRVDPVSQQLEQGIPSYVSPIPDEKIAGAQVAVFDRGQFTFSYVDKASRKLIDIRQFWINGRQFNVDDWIGNPASRELIQNSLQNVEPSLGAYSPNAAAKAWTHQTKSGLLVTNPGYFTNIAQVNATDQNGNPVTAYNYDYGSASTPSYTNITGLETPHTPVSTTAEEWLLVNNSDLFHPFHIHINPFFVTEIGQLNYDGKSWSLKKITLGQKADTKVPFSWVVGNWWDVITIPPHGYVKFRMWINVPTQHPVDKSDPDSDLVVTDNSNTYGSWVFHCHILRHEDRGMMLMVNTTPKTVSLGSAPDGDQWTQDDKGVTYHITDNHGGLTLTTEDQVNPIFKTGTFSRGIGNPLYSQPFLGSMTDSSGVISAFCLENTGNRMLSSNGHFYLRNGASYQSGAAASSSLVGSWIDDSGNKATIALKKKDPKSNSTKPTSLTFTADPSTPVWWTQGTGLIPAPVPATPATPTTPAVAASGYTGNVVLLQDPKNKDSQNQLLTYCISADLNTLVFSNGITWTRAKP